MSSAVAVRAEMNSLRELIDKLVQEHRAYPAQVDGLARSQDFGELGERFVRLQDSLTEHMLSEEFEVYPELMKRGLFDETTSTIMQQHHDLTASLGKMELALRIRNLGEFRAALGELDRILRVHQPAEEEKVFPRAL
jgi:hemerythrin superfamily protein